MLYSILYTKLYTKEIENNSIRLRRIVDDQGFFVKKQKEIKIKLWDLRHHLYSCIFLYFINYHLHAVVTLAGPVLHMKWRNNPINHSMMYPWHQPTHCQSATRRAVRTTISFQNSKYMSSLLPWWLDQI